MMLLTGEILRNTNTSEQLYNSCLFIHKIEKVKLFNDVILIKSVALIFLDVFFSLLLLCSFLLLLAIVCYYIVAHNHTPTRRRKVKFVEGKKLFHVIR